MGGREVGKSYSVAAYYLKKKMKLKEGLKLYWCRLTDTQCGKLLANNAARLIDPDLMKKYGIKTYTRGSTVYTYKEAFDENGKPVKTEVMEYCEVPPLSTMANTKGCGFYDNTYTGEYAIILDEFQREEGEKDTFSIVYNFSNLSISSFELF